MSDVPRVPDDDVRVGDVERRAVDERLRGAVGEGLLTLAEYDERAAALWAARTRGALRVLTADLPAPPAAQVPDVRRSRRRRRRVLVGLAAAGALVLFVVPARTTAVSVGGTSAPVGVDATVFVQPGETVHEVGPEVGDVTVVVPDGVRAVLEVAPGSREVECEEACEVVSDRVVRIVVSGGAGEVEVETASEHD